MKIFSAKQIKEWDNYTITHEPVSSGKLMERAARACYDWLIKNNFHHRPFKIFCGQGNNGGDGLAIAAMLVAGKSLVSVHILDIGQSGSPDFKNNLEKLHTSTSNIYFIQSQEHFPPITTDDVIIDALFGTGLNTPPKKLAGLLINYLNNAGAAILSVDIPSGLNADKTSQGNAIIKAEYTLTFQQHKLAFMVAENEQYFGKVELLTINLHQQFYEQHTAQYQLTNPGVIKVMYRPRMPFSNKGDFGHACLLAGSYGMMGAAVLAARACVKSGVGKLTAVVCKKGYDIMQISVPEAMCAVNGNTFIKDFTYHQKFTALGVGPGIGIYESHKELLLLLFKNCNNIILDADALNTIARHKEMLSSLPKNCIITPHPKEFDRIFGKCASDFERMDRALEKSQEYQLYIVLKGHRTLISTPDKKAWFNSTGNAGMAKGGSGDVLTGILTGLVAQGYTPNDACILGVYLHGLAGDIAAEKFCQEAMTAGDINDCLGEAFKRLKSGHAGNSFSDLPASSFASNSSLAPK